MWVLSKHYWSGAHRSVYNDKTQAAEILSRDYAGKGFVQLKPTQHFGTRVLNLLVSSCSNCDRLSLWEEQLLIYPQSNSAPQPNKDMSEDIREDYIEAASILDRSPRGAAALLRLAIQKLCKELGQAGKNINTDIGHLVKNGLNAHVQKSLDSVRVIGNEAVHPGVLDLRDDKETALALFSLVNFIIEKMISEPKEIDAIYASLPANKIKGIESRDK